MDFLQNIGIVARYEAKTLRRSWFFRLFAVGALFIFTILNIGLFSPVGDESCEMISIPSAVPLVNLYLLNIAQALVVIFLAADFLKKDKKLDTNEVLYTRSISNFEYVTGKTWGILRLFLGLDLLILGIGLLMNIISRNMSVDIMAYLWYLIIICVPTIIFSLGLAYMLMSVIRNQAITFMLLLGYAALNMFYLYHRAGSLFDYMAFGFPVFKSGVIGFDNPGMLVSQRLLYFSLGFALVMATILLFKRLPQSRFQRGLTIVLLVVFTVTSALCATDVYSNYKKKINDKNLVLETNRQYENRNFVSITEADIELSHKGLTFEASASLRIINDNREEIDTWLFSLNPSLSVLRITSGGSDLSFKRVNHVIEADPGKTLLPGHSDSLKIFYSGTINESFCFPDYTDNVKDNPYRIDMLNVSKRQAFLTEKYVLLTPEAHWYPVSGLNYYPSNPARIKIDFIDFTLKVKTSGNLTAVSQGNRITENGYYRFKPGSPLTGLTLAIGNYLSDSIRVDSVEYISHYFPGNDYYKKDLAGLKDTLSLLVSGIMRELETNFSTKYPFSTLTLLEVPVQFYSYPRNNTQTRAEVQPSMVLVPEKLSTLRNAGFAKQFTRQKRRMARNNQIITDKELQVRLFNDFIRNTFISGENFRFVNGVAYNEPVRYRLGPSFYFFKNNFYSSEYPVINAVFESHLQKVDIPGRAPGMAPVFGGLSDNDKANLILKEYSFRELLAKNPGADTIRTILAVKGDYLFNLFRAKAGIDEFKEWFLRYIDDNKFRRVDILQMNDDMEQKFGFGFYPYLSDWFNGKELAGFLFTNLQTTEIISGDRSRYLVSFTVSNPEPVPGLFNVSFRTGAGPGGMGPGGRQMIMTEMQGSRGGGFSISMQGRGMEASDISRIVFLGPEESRRINIVLDAQPRALLINTITSRNIPGEISLPVGDIPRSRERIREVREEEILPLIPEISDPSEIIVDNEDPGFTASRQVMESPLKRLLGVQDRNEQTYQQIRMMNAPEYWQPVVQSAYYGKYIRSAVYTRGGSGDRKVSWNAVIDKPGYYDIYTYIGKSGDMMMVRTGRAGGGGGPQGAPPAPPPPGGQGSQGDSPYKDMRFLIYHDEGVEEITLDYGNAEGGWNNLGRYYLSPDSVKVELSNLSAGRIVIGDAVKWVLQR
ncbi:MAG: hypothetical protein R6W81_13845 [Bacteroidales bacterium]